MKFASSEINSRAPTTTTIITIGSSTYTGKTVIDFRWNKPLAVRDYRRDETTSTKEGGGSWKATRNFFLFFFSLPHREKNQSYTLKNLTRSFTPYFHPFPATEKFARRYLLWISNARRGASRSTGIPTVLHRSSFLTVHVPLYFLSTSACHTRAINLRFLPCGQETFFLVFRWAGPDQRTSPIA